MTRTGKLLLVLILAVCLLCGCASAPQEQEIICNELRLALPVSFSDFSEDGVEEGLAFNYADVDMGICGSFEEKAYLEQYIPDMDAEKYAQAFVQSNNIDAVVETVDGISRFTYSVSGDPSYTYLCGVFESQKNFWVIQAYCVSADYQVNAEAMWSYITSVTIE